MKTIFYIFNTFMMVILASINTGYASTLDTPNELKLERYSVLGAWFLFGICMLITYLVWKKRSRAMIYKTCKPRIRNYEVLAHGKRLVITKKILSSQNTSKKVA